MQEGIPEMSGALPDSNSISPSDNQPGAPLSDDHVLPREPAVGLTSSDAPAARNQRRESFFVISDGPRGGTDNSMPRERIAIRPTQRARTFEIGNSKRTKRNRIKQSSLEAILRHATNGPVLDTPEAQLPLPDSKPASVSSIDHCSTKSKEQYRSCSLSYLCALCIHSLGCIIHSYNHLPGGVAQRISVERQSKSSLEILAQQGSRMDSEPLPNSIPLPDSRPESIEISRQQQKQAYEHKEDQEQPQQQPVPLGRHAPPPGWGPHLRRFDYVQILERATEILPHLSNERLRSGSRHDILNISFMDFSHAYRSKLVEFHTTSRDANVFNSLGAIPDHVKQRLVIVEDLSPRIIDVLGQRFGINPELFQEHLINSGYAGAEYQDPPAHTWTTSGRRKSYASLKWYRPVLRLAMVPYSNQDLKDLLDPAVSRLEYTSDNSKDLSVFETETNIFRSPWDLWTDPGTTSRMERNCGWEERVSVWHQKIPDRDCEIVVVLLDPLPTLGQGIERKVTAAKVIHDSDSDTESIGSQSLRGGPTQSMTDAEALDRLAEHIKERRVQRKPLTTLQRMLQRITFGKPPGDNASGISQKFAILETKTFTKVRSRTILEQNVSRARIDVDFEDAFQSPALMDVLTHQLKDTTSTRNEFCQRLETTRYEISNVVASLVAQPLFHMIRKDVIEILRVLQNTLDRLNVDILDDVTMEESLSIWRGMITRAQLELPEMKRSMIRFFSFLRVLDASAINSAPNTGLAGDQHEIEDENIARAFEDLCVQIDGMLLKLQTASSSLTSNMALLDSRRSIAEAQAVTKLTELAFFFIPLTFAASLFGMQIEQFENRAPLSTFIALAIAFTAFSYMVRLMIRSMWLRGAVRTYRKSIKVYADKKRQPVQRGSVPASLFLSWLGYELVEAIKRGAGLPGKLVKSTRKTVASFWEIYGFGLTTILLLPVVAAAPIAVLWTRPINHGIQSLVTIVILVSVIGLITIPYWRYGDPEAREALPKLLKRRFQRFKVERSKLVVLLICICALAIMVVPLAILWTKPVSSGIKVAVTVVIIFVAVLSVLSYGIYRLVSVTRDSGSSSSSGSRSLVDE